MSGEVQAVKQMPPKSLGDNLIIAGQQLAAMGAATSVFCPGYMGGFGGFGGPIFAVPGFDAADIYARQKLTDIMFGNGTNTANPAGTTTGGGITDAATANAKTTNPADSFSKIKYEKIEEMAQKEEAIKAKEEEIKKEEDAERKEALSKELVQLQNEYRKLDAQLGNGSQLSKTFGDKEFSFYSNIQPKEYQTIGEINAEIGKMKEALAKLEKEGVDLANEREQVRAQLRSKAGMFSTIDDQTVLNNMSPEKRDRYNKVNKEREDLIKQIEGKIGELKTYISDEVLKDDNDNNNFYTSVVGQRTKEKEEAKKTEGSNIAQIIDDMYSDGKLKDKKDIKAELDKISKGKYDDTARNAVLERIYAVAQGKSKEEFKKALEEKDFFAKVSTIELDDKNIEKNGKELALLQEVYDKIIGSGKFKANYEKYRKEDKNAVKVEWKNIETAITRANKSSSSSSSDKTPRVIDPEKEPTLEEIDKAKKYAAELDKKAKETASTDTATSEEKIKAQNDLKDAEEAVKKAEIRHANAVLSSPGASISDPGSRIFGGTKADAANNMRKILTSDSREHMHIVKILRETPDLDIDNLSDVELVYAMSNGLKTFKYSGAETRGKIALRLNDLAKKYNLTSKLYLDEDQGRGRWNCDEVRLYTLDKVAELNDDDDIHLIGGGEDTDADTAKDVGKCIDTNARFDNTLVAMARLLEAKIQEY